MSTFNPNLTPGDFVNPDGRDTHPVPGQQAPVYPPVEPPSEAIYSGATPTLPAEQTGAGGGLMGEVGVRSDGFQLDPPKRHAQDEVAQTATGIEGDAPDDSEHRTDPVRRDV